MYTAIKIALKKGERYTMKRKLLSSFALIAAVSAGFICGGSVTGLNAAPDSLRGDVNEDGIVNILDFIELKSILLGADTQQNPPVITELKSSVYKFNNFNSPVKEISKIIISSADEMDKLDEFFNSTSIDKETIEDTSGNFTDGYIPSGTDFEKNVYLFFTANGSYYEIPDVCAEAEGSSVSVNVRYHNGLIGKYLYRVEIPRSIYNNGNIEISEETIEYPPGVPVPAKPVIYLYPEETTDINVKLKIDRSLGNLTCTYPYYNEKTGWSVTAEPDSTLHDSSGREFSYLFWEGVSEQKWDMTSGFVVRGCDTADFLREKLEYLGLTPREYNEFIVYWMPQMQNNEYNLISFQTDKYEEYAPLEITPEPDCIQRVFMTYTSLDKYTDVPEQQLEPFERHGYSVIEWGGTEIGSDNYTVR